MMQFSLYYRYYFQLLAAESQIAQGFFKIITHYGWKRISLIIQNENLFTVVRKKYVLCYDIRYNSYDM